MKRRRVLVMISSLRGGGSEKQTLLFLRHLDRALFEPQLYVLDREGELRSEVPADVMVHCFGDSRPSHRFNFPGRIHRDQVRHLAALLRQESIDVVYDRTFHMAMIASPACVRDSIPRVSTIVSPPDLALPLVESRFVRLKRHRLATAYRRSRAVVAVSRCAAASAQSFYRLPADRVQVIPNPIDVQRTLDLAAQTEVDRDDRLTLVSVGRMSPEKGHEDLINALLVAERSWPASAGAIRLWVIGDGELRGRLQTLAGQLSGKHQVEFIGACQNPAPYIAAADALVLPSRFEGMPNVVLEAMALQTPVIATRCGGTVELEREASTILWCEPGEPQSIADAIAEFSNDPPAANRRVIAARQMIADHHQAAATVRRIESLLL